MSSTQPPGLSQQRPAMTMAGRLVQEARLARACRADAAFIPEAGRTGRGLGTASPVPAPAAQQGQPLQTAWQR